MIFILSLSLFLLAFFFSVANIMKIKKRKKTNKQNKTDVNLYVLYVCARVCVIERKTKSRQPPQINKLKNTPEGRINEDNI